jgi:molybdate transport system substrate-binding protein
MSKKMFVLVVLMFTLTIMLAGCGAKPVTLEVYAGGSTQSVMLAIKETYEQQHSNVTINYNFAGSKTLEETMRTLQQGDLYIATPDDIERMSQDGLIIESQPIASLTPAIIVLQGSSVVTSWDDLAKDGVRIAIINPDLGTAGTLVEKIIGKSPLKDLIQANITTFVAAPNEMVKLLTEGKVDAAIVWSSLAQSNAKLTAIEIPAEISESLEMWVSIPTYTTSESDASAFLEFITGAEGQQAFTKAGFAILGK